MCSKSNINRGRLCEELRWPRKWGFPVRTLMTALLPAPQVPGEAPQGRSRQGRGELRDKPQRTGTRKRFARPRALGRSRQGRGELRDKPTMHRHPQAIRSAPSAGALPAGARGTARKPQCTRTRKRSVRPELWGVSGRGELPNPQRTRTRPHTPGRRPQLS